MTITYPDQALYPGADVYPASLNQLAIPDPTTVAGLLSGSRIELFEAIVRNGVDTVRLDVADGSTTEDLRATPQITMQATLVSAALVPREATDLLHPDSGSTIEIRCGVQSLDTGAAWFTQGTFHPTEVDADFGPSGTTITVTAADVLAARTRGRRLDRKYQLWKGQDVEAAAFEILASRDPGLRFELGHTTGKVTARITVGPEGEDPVKAVNDQLGKPAGARLVQGVDNVVRLMPITDPLVATPKATWTTDSASVVQRLKFRATKSPDAICSPWQDGFLIVPEDKGQIIQFDGDHSVFDTENKCRDALEAQLAMKRGQGRQVDVQAWVNYSLHAGDVVAFRAVGLSFNGLISRRELSFRSPVSGHQITDRREAFDD